MTFADFWQIITTIGKFELWLALIFFILIIYSVLPKSKKTKIAFLAFVLIPSIIISAIITESLKLITKIPRPCTGYDDCPSGYSFPSSHATTVFVLATVVWLNIRKFEIRSVFLILAILVSLSRVALNYHAHADIVAGALLGTAVAYLINTLYKRKSSSIKAFKRIIS